MVSSRSPIENVQHWLRDNQLQGMVIPNSDEYQNEYVPACARRLQWLTHFSGSAGRALVLQDKAALFVDDRYTAQAKTQTCDKNVEVLGHTEEIFAQWLVAHLLPDSTIAFDPRLHTLAEVQQLRQQLTLAKLHELAENPIDTLWRERPARVRTPVEYYPFEYAGLSSDDKRSKLCPVLCACSVDYCLVTAPEEVAWLLNIRARDLPTVPVSLSYVLLAATSGKVDWFVSDGCVSQALSVQLGKSVTLRTPAMVEATLASLGSGLCFGLNLKRTPYHLIKVIEVGNRFVDTNLIEQEKSRKNSHEISGAIAAQKHDCLAVIKFLCWLETSLRMRTLTEIDAADNITGFRRQCSEFIDVSFVSISASGPHSALAHYSVTEQTNRVLNDDTIYLIDSGGQYYGGTTDITRTVAIGAPSLEQKRAYTLVLKGHIALATCRFPVGTSGTQLDVLARQYLWQQGMDYDHGTGHGVGSYLSVHEGPAAIGVQPNSSPLCEGMILSNEPGYYEEGNFGIRIENLVLVKKSLREGFLEFDTISHVPMDYRLVEFSLLSEQERGWLKRYHSGIKTEFAPEVTDREKQWLADAIEPFIEL